MTVPAQDSLTPNNGLLTPSDDDKHAHYNNVILLRKYEITACVLRV